MYTLRGLLPAPAPVHQAAPGRRASSLARAAKECVPAPTQWPAIPNRPGPRSKRAPTFLQQSLLEKELLAKLLSDKRRELAAYDAQLEEYMSLSVARAAAGSKPLVPAFAASALRSVDAPGAEGALQALSEQSGSSQRELLQRLLAAKQTELAKAKAEAAQYSALLAQRAPAARSAPAPAPSAIASTSSSADSARVRELEALLAEELRKKKEQVELQEELLRINEEQVAANKLLVAQLLAAAPTPVVQWTEKDSPF
jgi:hypothetical protein